jgi:hypothetical protein
MESVKLQLVGSKIVKLNFEEFVETPDGKGFIETSHILDNIEVKHLDKNLLAIVAHFIVKTNAYIGEQDGDNAKKTFSILSTSKTIFSVDNKIDIELNLEKYEKDIQENQTVMDVLKLSDRQFHKAVLQTVIANTSYSGIPINLTD